MVERKGLGQTQTSDTNKYKSNSTSLISPFLANVLTLYTLKTPADFLMFSGGIK